MKKSEPICDWYLDLAYLSPQYDVPIVFDGVTYPNIRLAYEATKFPNPEDRKPLESGKPWAAAKEGRDYPVAAYREEWRKNLTPLLLGFLAQKYGLVKTNNQHKNHLRLGYWLVCTAPHPLVYANLQDDHILGRCYCQHCSKSKVPGSGQGENLLGILTEAIRNKMVSPETVTGDDCDFCFYNRRDFKITPATEMMVWLEGGKLIRKATCKKHKGVYTKQASRGDGSRYYTYPITDTPDPDHNFATTQLQLPAPVAHVSTSVSNWRPPRVEVVKGSWGFSMIEGNDFKHFAFGTT